MYDLMLRRLAPWNRSRLPRKSGPVARRARPQAEMLEARIVLSVSNSGGTVALGLGAGLGVQSPYLQTNLASDLAGEAQVTDPNLVNPWGVSYGPTGPFWISAQGTNNAPIYGVSSGSLSNFGAISIPTTSSGPQGPTGQVYNNTSSFPVAGSPADFIFANLNGTISAWNFGAGGSAQIEATTSGAVYTGLAIATNTSGSFLYAANDSQGTIDVFDGSFTPTNLGTNAFVDPRLPSGLVPFNIQLINGDLFVTYAPAGHENQVNATPGQGAVATFTTSGKFLSQLITGSKLASPWGITLAPAGFGQFSGDLLVGNFAYNYSVINAFDPSTGAYRGTLDDASGHAIFNQALWSLTFGNGVNGGDPNTLYFTAGIDGETHGLFGSIQAVPTLSSTASLLPNLPDGAFQTIPTVPANGDLNPYGVAVVPQGFPTGGLVNPGDILVSNFNNSSNEQGTGTTIVDIAPNGSQSLFYQGPSTPGQLGLTTALGILKSGFVIVGSLPTLDGTSNTIQAPGSLLILNSQGQVVTTLSDSTFLDGPWDLTVSDQGSRAEVFVSNVLSGTITRLDLEIPNGGNPIVVSETQIASGYFTRTDPAALVIGPTGLAFDPKSDTLYVASTGNNAIYAIPHAALVTHDAGMGNLVYEDDAHLRGPLGLALAPNGDLITSNGDAINPDPSQTSELVEFTPGGQFVDEFSVDPNPGGAFGLAVTNTSGELRLAAVDDNTNSLDVWTFATGGRTSKSADTRSPAASQPTGASFTSMGTSLDAQTKGPAVTTLTGGNAAAVDQLFLAIQEEDLHAALFGRSNGVRDLKKNPSGTWTV